MKITVSGEKKEVADGITVSALIEQEQVETPQYVTVSVNEEFIDIENLETRKTKDENATIIVSFNINDKSELAAIVSKIRSVEGVVDIVRV